MTHPIIMLVLTLACSAARVQTKTPTETHGQDSTVVGGFSSDGYDDPQRMQLCAGVLNWYECSRIVEAARLPKHPTIKRDSVHLILPIADGSVIVLSDRHSPYGIGGSGAVIAHTFERVIEGIDAYLVALHYYEGGAHLLVSRQTGKATRIDVAPAVSPDRRRLVTASWGGHAGYDPERLRIYRIDADSLLLEWELDPPPWVMEKAGWVNDSTVLVVLRTFDEDLTPVSLPPTRIVRTATGWREVTR